MQHKTPHFCENSHERNLRRQQKEGTPQCVPFNLVYPVSLRQTGILRKLSAALTEHRQALAGIQRISCHKRHGHW